jgi:hypothetical protein
MFQIGVRPGPPPPRGQPRNARPQAGSPHQPPPQQQQTNGGRNVLPPPPPPPVPEGPNPQGSPPTAPQVSLTLISIHKNLFLRNLQIVQMSLNFSLASFSTLA